MSIMSLYGTTSPVERSRNQDISGEWSSSAIIKLSASIRIMLITSQTDLLPNVEILDARIHCLILGLLDRDRRLHPAHHRPKLPPHNFDRMILILRGEG